MASQSLELSRERLTRRATSQRLSPRLILKRESLPSMRKPETLVAKSLTRDRFKSTQTVTRSRARSMVRLSPSRGSRTMTAARPSQPLMQAATRSRRPSRRTLTALRPPRSRLVTEKLSRPPRERRTAAPLSGVRTTTEASLSPGRAPMVRSRPLPNVQSRRVTYQSRSPWSSTRTVREWRRNTLRMTSRSR